MFTQEKCYNNLRTKILSKFKHILSDVYMAPKIILLKM